MTVLATAMASRLRLALDAGEIFRRAGMVPDSWQARLLLERPHQALLCCSRQLGKSSVTAALALHQAVTVPRSLVLVICPAQRQSAELVGKVRTFLSFVPEAGKPAGESVLSITLANSSRIVALPGTADTVRGYSGVNLLIIDEAGWLPEPVYTAVRPMIAISGGDTVVLSTPNGRGGWFYREWTHGEDWDRTKVTYLDVPRIPAEQIEAERAHMTATAFRQEHECEFVAPAGAVFDPDLIAVAMNTTPTAGAAFPVLRSLDAGGMTEEGAA